MQPTVEEKDRLRPGRTRRVVMAMGAAVIVLGIGITVVANPTGSPAQPASSSLAASVVPPFSTWVTFTSSDGRFSASFPGEPYHHAQPGTSAGAEVTREVFEWSTRDAATTFDVAYMDYPAGSLSTAAPETVFADMERWITTAGFTILASHSVSGSHPGHEFTITGEGGQTTLRQWIAGDRTYVVGAQGESPDTEAFLDSFRILGE